MPEIVLSNKKNIDSFKNALNIINLKPDDFLLPLSFFFIISCIFYMYMKGGYEAVIAIYNIIKHLLLYNLKSWVARVISQVV